MINNTITNTGLRGAAHDTHHHHTRHQPGHDPRDHAGHRAGRRRRRRLRDRHGNGRAHGCGRASDHGPDAGVHRLRSPPGDPGWRDLVGRCCAAGRVPHGSADGPRLEAPSREGSGQRARIRLLRALCSTSARPEHLEHRRHVVAEAATEALLQPVPAADGVVLGTTPRLDGAGLGRLLLVGVAERHPVAALGEHRVQVVDAAQVVAQLGRSRPARPAPAARPPGRGRPRTPTCPVAWSGPTDPPACRFPRRRSCRPPDRFGVTVRQTSRHLLS